MQWQLNHHLLPYYFENHFESFSTLSKHEKQVYVYLVPTINLTWKNSLKDTVDNKLKYKQADKTVYWYDSDKSSALNDWIQLNIIS